MYSFVRTILVIWRCEEVKTHVRQWQTRYDNDLTILKINVKYKSKTFSITKICTAVCRTPTILIFKKKITDISGRHEQSYEKKIRKYEISRFISRRSPPPKEY